MQSLITGPTSGIGYEFALLLAEKDYNLILVSRNIKKLEELKSQLTRNHKIKVKIFQADLSKISETKEFYKKIQKEKIDLLINNAGFGYYSTYLEEDWEKDEQMITLNIATLSYLTKMIGRQMQKQNKGQIINVASTAGFQPGPYMATYFATKAFVLHFSEALSMELKNKGITVTALCPGPTETEFFNNANVDKSNFLRKNLPTAKQVAEFGYNQLLNNKTVAVYGFKNRLFIFIKRVLPRSIIRKIIARKIK